MTEMLSVLPWVSYIVIVAHVLSYPLYFNKTGDGWLVQPKMMLLMTLHHIAPVIAHLFQDPRDRFYNTLFYGMIWLPHSYGALKKGLTRLGLWSDPIEKGHKWVGAAATAVAYYYCLIHYSPEHCWFFLLTSAFQLIGRYFVVDNMIMVNFLGKLEFPANGSVLCVFMGGLSYWSLVYGVTWNTFYYLFYRWYKSKSVSFPEKLVRNAETEQFLKEYKLAEDQTADAKKQKDMKAFCEGYDWLNAEQYPLIYAVCQYDNETVRRLIADGHDPNRKITEWWDSTAISWATGIRNMEAAILLMQAGVDPFERTEHGQVQVQYACGMEPGVARFFIELGDICFKHEKKKNPLKPPKTTSKLA